LNGGASERAIRGLLTTVTDRLSLVVITITGENPYEIFESLNSTGLPLEQSDLIRNYLFMQIPLADQDEFNHEHWQAFERMFEADGTYVLCPLDRRKHLNRCRITELEFIGIVRSRHIRFVRTGFRRSVQSELLLQEWAEGRFRLENDLSNSLLRQIHAAGDGL